MNSLAMVWPLLRQNTVAENCCKNVEPCPSDALMRSQRREFDGRRDGDGANANRSERHGVHPGDTASANHLVRTYSRALGAASPGVDPFTVGTPLPWDHSGRAEHPCVNAVGHSLLSHRDSGIDRESAGSDPSSHPVDRVNVSSGECDGFRSSMSGTATHTGLIGPFQDPRIQDSLIRKKRNVCGQV